MCDQRLGSGVFTVQSVRLFLASPQNTLVLHSRGSQTPKRTEVVGQLIKPSLPSKTPGLGMSLPASSQKAQGHQASPPPSLHFPCSCPPCLPARVLASTRNLSSAPGSWSCLSYSRSVLWLLLGTSVGSSTILKQTKLKQKQRNQNHRKPFLWP